MAELLSRKFHEVEEVVDDEGASGEPMDLEATSAKLESMSAELDALLASLEDDVPAEVLESFHEDELERAGLAAAGLGDDAADPVAGATYESLKRRQDDVVGKLDRELKITEELKALQRELAGENAKRADDCRAAAAELDELKQAMDAMMGGGGTGVEAELNSLRARKAGTEETKDDANAPPPPPPRSAAPSSSSALHPDDAALVDDATPTDEEAQMMIMLMAKMKYQALGVENAQLAAQIADLEQLRKRGDIDLAAAARDLDAGGTTRRPGAETSAE